MDVIIKIFILLFILINYYIAYIRLIDVSITFDNKIYNGGSRISSSSSSGYGH